MRSFSRVPALLLAMAILCGWQAVAAADEARKGTALKLSDAYKQYCSACHGAGMAGSFSVPLANEEFARKWSVFGGRALLHFVSTAMPAGAEGSLDPDVYITIVNDIIAANGMGEPLPPGAAIAREAVPAEVLRMEADWGNRFPVHDDEIARAGERERTALLRAQSTVDDAMLANPPAQDWLHWRRTRDGHGFSPLKQINRRTVDRLQVAWALALPHGSNSITPLVHDGVIYVNSAGTVRAIDAKTGDILWQFARPVKRATQITQPRSMAIAGRTLYVGTADVHMLALDIETGHVVWDRAITPPESAYELSPGPLVVGDRIIQGISGCVNPAAVGGCFVVALDRATGREVWRFRTIAQPGQPGGDSWNGAPPEQRSGASVWSTASYDADLNLLFIGASQTYDSSLLLEPQPRKGESADALYTNSTLALNPETGKLVWYYQHFPGDAWDLDWAFERMVVTLDRPEGKRKAIVTAGKLGIFDVLDAATGKYLFSHDMGIQDLVQKIDPVTGRKTVRESARLRRDKPVRLCPSALGVRNWAATAFDPTTGTVFTPVSACCMDMSYNPSKQIDIDFVHLPKPEAKGMVGGTAALNLNSNRITWLNRRRANGASALLATAGGLVFEGARDRYFRAFDSTSGKELWKLRLDGVPGSFPVSFAVDGEQYIAVVAGGGFANDIFWRLYSPEIVSPADGTTLWVLKLGR